MLLDILQSRFVLRAMAEWFDREIYRCADLVGQGKRWSMR